MSELSRRGFFGSITSSSGVVKSKIRPPYIEDISKLSQCHTCEGLCTNICEEKIIKLDKNLSPYLDFSQSACTYCEKCFEVCDKDVLNNLDKKISAKVHIDTNLCVSHHGVMCFSCKDPCLDDAILFTGLFNPSIIDDKCTSCGFCISRCPSDAIKIEHIHV